MFFCQVMERQNRGRWKNVYLFAAGLYYYRGHTKKIVFCHASGRALLEERPGERGPTNFDPEGAGGGLLLRLNMGARRQGVLGFFFGGRVFQARFAGGFSARQTTTVGGG